MAQLGGFREKSCLLPLLPTVAAFRQEASNSGKFLGLCTDSPGLGARENALGGSKGDKIEGGTAGMFELGEGSRDRGQDTAAPPAEDGRNMELGDGSREHDPDLHPPADDGLNFFGSADDWRSFLGEFL